MCDTRLNFTPKHFSDTSNSQEPIGANICSVVQNLVHFDDPIIRKQRMVHALLWALEQPAFKFRLLADNFLAVTRFDAMTWSELVACCGAKHGNSILARKTIEGKRIKK